MSATHIYVTCRGCGREERVGIFDYYSEHFDLDGTSMEDVCHECVKKGEL